MNINDLAWLLVDGEHWEDIEDILDMNITDIDKDKLYQYLVEELVHNISEKKLDILIEKYK